MRDPTELARIADALERIAKRLEADDIRRATRCLIEVLEQQPADPERPPLKVVRP